MTTDVASGTADQQRGVCPFPLPRPDAFSLPQPYADLREGAGVTRVQLEDERVVWLVASYEANRALAVDDRLSSNRNLAGFPAPTQFYGEPQPVEEQMFLNLDNPEHDRIRRMFNKEFTIGRLNQLRPNIQAHVDELIDELLAAGDGADLVEDLAVALPVRVICELLGVPISARDGFRAYAKVIMSKTASETEASAAAAGMNELLGGLVTARLAEPADDLISRVANEFVAAGALSERQLVNSCTLLLAAGHDTSSAMIALGILALLEHPDQRAMIVSGEPAQVKNGVEELLRYLAIAQAGRRRVAVGDIPLDDGQVIRAGEGVVLGQDIGNHDPQVFECPEKLDLARPNARRHIAFGFGTHQCIGQNLARIEFEIVYRTLFTRIPTLRLAVPLEELEFDFESIAYSVKRLPVRW